MTLMKSLMGAAAAVALTAGAAMAEPALIFDLGGKFDKSFNEAAHNGAQRWAEETGGSYREIELQSEAQREQALRRFAEAGANPIITMGFAMADPLSAVAGDYPDTKFVAVDVNWLDAPNVRQVSFAEHEGSYLVGMMAAMASESGTVGFIGGMDIPLIRHFGCGYAQGAKAVNPDIEVVANMTGTTPAAWNDPVKGSALTTAQLSQGADVIYAAAGGTGVGVLQTAAGHVTASALPATPAPGPLEWALMPRMACIDTGRPTIFACLSPRKSTHSLSISNDSSKATRATSAAMARMRPAGTPQRPATFSGAYSRPRYLSAMCRNTVQWSR